MSEEEAPRKISFAKIASAIAVIGSIYAFGAHLYGDYQSNLQKIKDGAAQQVRTDIDRANYRAGMSKFQDSVRESFRELYRKEHLKPKF